MPTARRRGRAARAKSYAGRLVMLAIGVILVFILALGALNLFEFGRLD